MIENKRQHTSQNLQNNSTSKETLAYAAAVTGILSLILPFGVGIAAIILGVIGLKKQSSDRTKCMIGIVTGTISTVIMVIIFAVFINFGIQAEQYN